jgi:hypothetical protein
MVGALFEADQNATPIVLLDCRAREKDAHGDQTRAVILVVFEETATESRSQSLRILTYKFLKPLDMAQQELWKCL